MPSYAQESGARLEEVVVTATRRSENIQDVPMVITAISGADLAENNLTDFSDLTELSAGLQLNETSQGPEPSLRGVSSVTVSSGPPAVDIYFNESPVNGTIAFQSLYDIGQIEVLRGPQGTLRGNTAPAGAITVSSRRPELNTFGATVSADLSRREKTNVDTQAAVNLPLVDDRLALRLAGLIERNDGAGTENPFAGLHTENDVVSGRASLLFQPMERLEIFASYQYMQTVTDTLARVEGEGMGYNGPRIRGSQNLAVQAAIEQTEQTSHLGSLHIRYEFDSATLNYILGYSTSDSDRKNAADITADDPGHAILNPGRLSNTGNSIDIGNWSHELRLDGTASDGFIDYTVGAFRTNAWADVEQDYPQVGLPGVLGDPAVQSGPPTGPLNPRYLSRSDLDLFSGDSDAFAGGPHSSSVFGSATFHLPSGTHVRAGARRIWLTTENNFFFNLTPANIAATVPFPTSLCSTFIPGSEASPDYATACDIPFGPLVIGDLSRSRDFTAWVYDLSISQDISDNLMVYANYSHNWRGPGTTQGNVPQQYILVEPEESDNIEVGIKANLLDSRILFTAAAFQQDYEDYNASVSQVPFLDGSGTVMDAFSLTYNGDARIRGFESDVQALINENWTASVAVNYAKSEFKDAQAPCRDANFDGVPDTGTPTAAQFTKAGVNVATCVTDGPINGLPEWSANIQSEYVVPMGAAELYARGIYNWYGDGEIVSANQKIESYDTLNLYAGARGVGGNLDIGLYVRNAFDQTRRIDQGSELTFLGVPSGYRQVWYTQGREFGLTVRYGLGAG